METFGGGQGADNLPPERERENRYMYILRRNPWLAHLLVMIPSLITLVISDPLRLLNSAFQLSKQSL